MERGPALDTLLDLDGQILVVDPAGQHWVKIVVRRVPPTPAKPHGLDDSLTLQGPSGERLVDYDNAHPVRSGSGPAQAASPRNDHRHRGATIRRYDYRDAGRLLEDFWADVWAVLSERGVRS